MLICPSYPIRISVPLSLSSTDENGAARAVYLASALGDVTIGAATRIADADYTIGQATLTIDSGACISSRDYFETALRGPVIQQCSSCHNSMGRALEINPYVMTFPFEGEADFSPSHTINSSLREWLFQATRTGSYRCISRNPWT